MEGRRTLVPDAFEVPDVLETERFRLRMLTVHDLVRDYDAVMSSAEHLRSTYSVISGTDWPVGLTLEEDLIDLGWHQREFTLRYSFAYTVVSRDERTCLGCVYINPSRLRGHDAEVTMWVRASELDSGLDQQLYETVRAWIENTWPFQSPLYPGRSVSVEEYRSLPR